FRLPVGCVLVGGPPASGDFPFLRLPPPSPAGGEGEGLGHVIGARARRHIGPPVPPAATGLFSRAAVAHRSDGAANGLRWLLAEAHCLDDPRELPGDHSASGAGDVPALPPRMGRMAATRRSADRLGGDLVFL